ncbi:MAG: ABC transporter ATP-binding protein [Beijerinckiaceae bacterium]|nr:ABC transporter ATP-binding protein [Beijerinckiaceae bacterium]MDO9353526.1 ABC transporter ATP-binding protein [Solirubrobacteraceae bacterium]
MPSNETRDSDAILRCERLDRTFVSRDAGENRVLQDINFEMRKGEFVVLIGPSGCGKSTLLNIIAGFDRQTAGLALIDGRPIAGPGPDKAMVFQDYALLPWLNARENIEIGLKMQRMPAAQRTETALRFLELVGLAEAAERPVYKLSGGMQQRVSIARALALEPKVLLMDEPFGALDAFQRAIMHKELVRIWRATQATIIFVTHSLEEAVFLGERVVAMTPRAVGLTGELRIDMPRPRDPLSPEFAAVKRRLFEMITSHLTEEVAVFAE